MHVSLTENLEAMVKAKVESGLYNNASEVVREALRLMHKRDAEDQLRYEEFKRQAILGREQAMRGEFSTKSLDDLDRELEAEDAV